MIEINDILEIEKHINGLDAVIFDLDDTLYSEKDYVKSGFNAIANMFPEISTLYDELWNAFEKKEPAVDIVLSNHNLLSYKDEALRVYRFHTPNITPYFGVKEMIGRIRASKKVGIITDGRPEGQYAKLKALGFMDIPYIITDELGGVQYRKPCEKAFVLMCQELDVKPQKAIYVGDNMNKDFIGPQKIGMVGVLYKNKNGIYLDNMG